MSATELREENMVVGVPAVVCTNSSESKGSMERSFDLRIICQGLDHMPLEMYMDSVVSFMKNE